MPSSRKSNIRSRWYRSNEKPLESGSNSQKNADPIGEISSTKNSEFIDDLSNARPPKAPKKRQQNKNKNSFGKDAPSPNNRDQGRFSDSNNKDKAKKHNGDKKKKTKKNSTYKQRAEGFNNNGRGKKKPENRRYPEKKKVDGGKPQPKKSKLSSFIAKIFGK